MADTFTINPNEFKSGKAYALAFRTGAHKDKRKDKKHLRRTEKKALRERW